MRKIRLLGSTWIAGVPISNVIGRTDILHQTKHGETFFDHRTEHEGCPVVSEQWMAPNWGHQYSVTPHDGQR